MADDSFLGGLMASLSAAPANPLWNMGLGIMSAGKPGGNLGDSLMQAGNATMQNRAAMQQYAMGQYGLERQKAMQPLIEQALRASLTDTDGQPVPMGGQQPPMGGQQAPMGAQPVGFQSADPYSTPPPLPNAGGNPLRDVALGQALAFDPRYAEASKAYLNSPEAKQKALDAVQKGRQQQYQGPLATLDSVATSDKADVLTKNNDGLYQHWQAVAPQLGFDPVKDLNPANARTAATYAYNQIAGNVGLPPKPMPVQLRQIQRGNGESILVNPVTGDVKQGAPALSIGKYVDEQGNVRDMTNAEGVARKLQPYDPQLYAASMITPQALDDFYKQTLATGEMPSLSGRDPITASRFSNYVAEQAAKDGNTGIVRAATKQMNVARQKVIDDFMDPSGNAGGKLINITTSVSHLGSMLPLVDAMKSGNLTLLNKARQEYQKQTGQSAPTDYETLKNIAVNEVINAVSKSGGDAAERAAIMKPFDKANGPDILKGAISTAATALAGKTHALRTAWDVGTGGAQGSFDKFLTPEVKKFLGEDAPAAQTNAKGWELHEDKYGRKAYVSPDGKQYEALK